MALAKINKLAGLEGLILPLLEKPVGEEEFDMDAVDVRMNIISRLNDKTIFKFFEDTLGAEQLLGALFNGYDDERSWRVQASLVKCIPAALKCCQDKGGDAAAFFKDQ